MAMSASEIILKSGAEVYRVEDTAVKICRAHGISHVECFATPTEIALSLDTGNDDEEVHTFIKRVHGTEINLKKVSAVNKFTKTFINTDLKVDEGLKQLEEIKAIRPYPLAIGLIAAMMVGAFFVPYYYGSVVDMFVAAGISGVAFLLSRAIDRLKFPPFISIFLSCFTAAMIAMFIGIFFPADNLPALLVSGVSVFLPGVAITNAARDVLSGDYQSGVSRLIEALVIAVAIAIGVGAMMILWNARGLGPAPQTPSTYPLLLYILFGCGVTFGFAVVFEAPAKQLFVISLIGGAGMLCFEFLLLRDISMVGACFCGTLVVAILAEVASRAGNDVTTIFILPGIIPFVPGAMLYRTMSSIINNDFDMARNTAAETFMATGSIALGIIVVAAVTRLGRLIFRSIRGAHKARIRRGRKAENRGESGE